jgi:hypothetical protein
MLEVEVASCAASSAQVTELLPDLDEPPEQVSMVDRRKIMEALRVYRSASNALREFIAEARP